MGVEVGGFKVLMSLSQTITKTKYYKIQNTKDQLTNDKELQVCMPLALLQMITWDTFQIVEKTG